MSTAYLALGSNLGDRAANLRQAVLLLARAGLTVESRSRIYTTESVEGGGPEAFLNAALRVRTSLPPLELLVLIRTVETQMGRPASAPGEHRGGSRLIDIDILMYDDIRLDSPELELPHPRMHRRAFVLRPLLDVLKGGWVQDSQESWD